MPVKIIQKTSKTSKKAWINPKHPKNLKKLDFVFPQPPSREHSAARAAAAAVATAVAAAAAATAAAAAAAAVAAAAAAVATAAAG